MKRLGAYKNPNYTTRAADCIKSSYQYGKLDDFEFECADLGVQVL